MSQPLLNNIRRLWLFAGWILLWVVLFEGSLAIIFYFMDKNPGHRAAADTYPDSSWVSGYFEEFDRSSKTSWQPYVYWRRDPFDGEYINILPDGTRKTDVGDDKPMRDGSGTSEPTILFYGGSTMWGTGARDDFTIPSLIAREIRDRGFGANIVNRGESGYVSTQEVIDLIRQLQAGNIPDLVIFFDGVNDVFSAFQNGVPAIPENESHRVREFKGERWWFVSLSKTSSFRLVSSLRQQIRKKIQHEPHANPDFVAESPLPPAELARETVNAYLENVEIVQVLGRHYGFDCLFYWQPTLFSKKYLSEYEMSELEKGRYLENFFNLTAESLNISNRVKELGVIDLYRLFQDSREPYFIDLYHLGEEGNTIVAAKMIEEIIPLLENTNSTAISD